MDEVLSHTGAVTDQAARIAGGLGGLGGIAIPETIPILSGMSATATKAALNGPITTLRTVTNLAKYIQLHKGNVGEAMKAMAREENVGRATAKVVGGWLGSFAGSRAGSWAAKYSSSMVGAAQKAYHRVDNMVRYRA